MSSYRLKYIDDTVMGESTLATQSLTMKDDHGWSTYFLYKK